MTQGPNQNQGDAMGIQAEVSGGQAYQAQTINITNHAPAKSQIAPTPKVPFLAPPLPYYYVLSARTLWSG